MNRLLTAVCLLLCCSLLISAATAGTIVVPDDHPTIQQGIDSAQPGDTVLVGPGAWLEQLDFKGKGLVLQSQAGPLATILQPLSPDSAIIRISSGEPTGTRLAGFTLRGGQSRAQLELGGGADVLVENCRFSHYGGSQAVVSCDGARVQLQRCVFFANEGLACIGVYSDTVTVLNSTLDHNAAGMFVLGGAAEVRNCIITFSTQYGLRGDSVQSDYNVVWNNVPNYDAGATSGAHDLFADPGFTAAALDFTLRDSSICIDAGDPDSLYLDPDSSRNDIGAYPLGTVPLTLPVAVAMRADGPSLSRIVDSLPVFRWQFYDSFGSYGGYEFQVGADNDWSVAELWATGEILQSDTVLTYAGLPLDDGTTYVARLRVFNGTAWGDWQSVGLHTNTPPPAPPPQHPLNRDSLHVDNAVLTVFSGSDADADALTCEFSVFSDSLLTDLVAIDTGVAVTPGLTQSRPLAGLLPDSTYWWRARVTDRYEYSVWSDTGSFVGYQGPRTIRVPSEEPTIRAAVMAAASGDTILVADGVYSGDGNRVISFGGKDLVLHSENGPAVTIIDCGDSLGGLFDGFRVTANQDSASLVRGFTVRNADNAVVLEASPRLQWLVLENNTRGILTYGSLNTTMDSLTIRANQTGLASEEYATITLRHSLIVANTVGISLSDGTIRMDSCRVDSNAIGMDLVHASITLDSCRLAHNGTGVRTNVGPVLGVASLNQCLLDSNGVAVYGDCRVRNSTIRGGQVGIDLAFPDHARLDTVLITGVSESALRHLLNPRTSLPIGADTRTGTPGFLVRQSWIVENPGSSATIESAQDGDYNVLQIDSTVIAGNGGRMTIGGALSMYGTRYVENGGPLHCSVNDYVYGRRSIEACTFAGNDSGALLIYADSALLEIRRTIVADNGGAGIAYHTKDSSQPLLSCNNVYGNLEGDYAGVIDSAASAGNISAPPRFCNPSAGDYALFDISPCNPVNNPCSTLIGALSVDCINASPEIVAPDTLSVFEDSLLVFHPGFIDLDGPDTILQISGLPSWLTQEADSLYGVPTEGVADSSFLITVSDGYAADTQLVVVNVIPVNDPPSLDAIALPTLVQLDTLVYRFSASDIENDSLVLRLDSLPSGATVIDSGNGNAVLTWVVDTLTEGELILKFIAEDSSLADTAAVPITVRSRRPTVLGVTVDGVAANLRVTTHTPELAWSYIDSAFGYEQSMFEVAVGVDTNWDFAEIWNPAPVAGAESSIVLNGAPLLDGTTYYLRLRVKNDTLYSPWYNDSLRLNWPPSLPGVTAGSVSTYETLSPTLRFANSADNDGDSLTYACQLFADSLLDSLIDSVLQLPEAPDSTDWTVGSVLEENRLYWWRVQSTDGFEASGWTDPITFYIDVSPQAPQPFSAVALPVDSGGTLYEMLPVFQWEKSLDPDLFDSVIYHMEIAQDSLFSAPLLSDTVPDTMYTLVDSLEFHKRYWWRLEAIDRSDNVTACSTILSFRTWTLGDITGNHVVNLTDLTRLINSLFITFQPIVPYFVADMDASCTVNLTDISLLANYLFFEGNIPRPGCAPPLSPE